MAKRRKRSTPTQPPTLSDKDITAIEALARTGIRARRPEGGVSLADGLTPVALPAALEATITTDAPLRQHVLDDAPWWLGRPRPADAEFGCVLLNDDEVARAKDGTLGLRPARFQLAWDGMAREETLASIALEGGRWRVVQLWSKADRTDQRRHRESLQRLVALASSQADC